MTSLSNRSNIRTHHMAELLNPSTHNIGGMVCCSSHGDAWLRDSWAWFARLVGMVCPDGGSGLPGWWAWFARLVVVVCQVGGRGLPGWWAWFARRVGVVY